MAGWCERGVWGLGMDRRLLTVVVVFAMVFLSLPVSAGRALAADGGGGSVSLTSIGTAYLQDFDTLTNSPDASLTSVLPTGWMISESGSSARNDGKYAVGTGSSTTGDHYSFGAPVGNADRALGELRSGTLVPIFGASFTNNTGVAVTRLDVSYTGEQWRLGALRTIDRDRIDFQYSLSATSLATGTWVDVDALDFSSPITTGTVGALNGNLAANRTSLAASIFLAVPAGATFWVRWTDFDVPSSDDGLAVDSFALTPRVVDAPPIVTATSPLAGAANVAVDTTVVITFSEPVNLSDPWFSISCSVSGAHTAAVSGGPTILTLDPTVDLGGDEACTVTVVAARVSDQDLDDPPDTMAADYVFSFTTIAAPTPIHDIQGAGHRSPLSGTLVKNVPGVVTAKRTNGFYMQDPNADADPATSEGIFVFTSSAPTVSAGDAVSVRGTVQEFRPGGAASANLTVTELTGVSVTKYSSGNALPAAIVIGTDRTPPTEVIEDDAASGDVETSGTFDPATDGIDFWESLEAMLVSIPDPLITGPSNSFNEISVLANNGAGATSRSAHGGVIITAADKNPEKIVVDDEVLKVLGLPFPTQINVGDRFAGSVTGVVDYNFGLFMVELTAAPTKVAGGLVRETTTAPGAHELTIATFNVENLDPGDATFATMADLIVNRLLSPDVISLEEIQDNNGETNDGTVDATVTLTKLRDAVVVAGGPTYQWREIDPVDLQDGGAPGGNIRQVFFFRADRGVSFVDRPGAGSTTANSVVSVGGGPQLQYSPGRIDPANGAFNSSRKPLAAELTYNGHRVFVIANHFNSKGGDDPLWGRRQPPVLSSEVQRQQQANVVKGFVQDILALDALAEIVVLGDLNDFEFSNPLLTLKSAPLNDLIETLPAKERYTYVFEGNSQTLDHILVSNSLLGVATTDVVHVNSEFWDQASDHEPQVARLLLLDTTPPTITLTAAPAPNANGWNNTDVTVTFTCADNVGIATCVGDATLTAETAGQTVTGTATDLSGNTATASATIRIDKTAQAFTWTGTTSYSVDQTVGISCATNAAISGVDLALPNHCDSASGPAFTFGLGTHTLTAAATDRAGNGSTASTTFTVSVSSTSLCALATTFVADSRIANSLCVKLDAAAASLARGNSKTHDNQLQAFVNEVNAQRAKAISDANAATLIALAGAL